MFISLSSFTRYPPLEQPTVYKVAKGRVGSVENGPEKHRPGRAGLFWNALPRNIQDANTYQKFKYLYKEFLR